MYLSVFIICHTKPIKSFVIDLTGTSKSTMVEKYEIKKKKKSDSLV